MTSLSKPKVVIIGAGLAGLTTAYRLQKAGIDVDLYEARNRVGGRVFSIQLNGHVAELGGYNMANGGNASNLIALINELDLELFSSSMKINHEYFNGSDLLSVTQLLKSQNFDFQQLKNKLMELSFKARNMKEVLDEFFNEDDPLYKILAVRLASYEGDSIEKLSPIYTETLLHMLLGGICAVHQAADAEEETTVELVCVKGGNALLPQKIAECLGGRLHLNMPLTKVSKRNESFTLTFQNHQEIQADILVLALPCTQFEKIHFEDAIPLERLQGIQSVRYGMNAKILVPFFHSPSNITGVINDDTISFLNADTSLLTLYYTGKSSLFLNNSILETYTQSKRMIKRGFGEACPALIPTYASDENFVNYSGPVGYSWPNDPYVRGSYSYISPGQEALLTTLIDEEGETYKKLFAPLQERLYFAGEHASILLDVPGTMEAACESGERVARAILKRIHRNLYSTLI